MDEVGRTERREEPGAFGKVTCGQAQNVDGMDYSPY